MTALEELLAIAKAISVKKSSIDKLVDRMVREEAEALGKAMIDSLQDSRSETTCDEGYASFSYSSAKSEFV